MADEMDYVVQDAQDHPLSPPQQPQHQHHLPQHHQPQYQQHVRQCPYWSEPQLSGFPPHYGPGLSGAHSQNQAGATPNNRSRASHSYDPVHSSIPALNHSWYPGTPPYHWSPVTLPHPRPPPDSFWPYPGNSAGAAGSDQSPSSSGPVQPPVVQNQQTPRHEPFTPFPIAFHHQSANLHRFGAVPAAMSAPNPTQQNSQQTGQQPPSFTSSSSDFPTIRLPALSPPVLPRPAHSPQPQPRQDSNSRSNMPGSSAPSVASGSAVMPVAASGEQPDPARRIGVPFDGSSRHPETPPQATGNTAAPDAAGISPPSLDVRSENPRRLLSMRMARTSTRRSDTSDYDSDEDAADEQERALEYLDQLSASGAVALRGEDLTEARIRAQQLLRGQMSTKRVASKTALVSLQSVDINTLPEKDRMCIICYNDFGVENPEGINEAPLRLPKCKHVFGDHCIKKWLGESDSCPYCRDKVPSEPQYKAGHQAIREYLSRATAIPIHRSNGRPYLADHSAIPSGQFAMLRDYPSDASRYAVRPLAVAGADASPTRAWQTGERRSPPSEAQESRRRTRPRHGSFRTPTAAAGRSLSYTPGNPSASPHQQSLGRDRVNPPYLPPQWLPYAPDVRRSLTSLTTGQFSSGIFRQQPQYGTPEWSYERAERARAMESAQPLGLNPLSAPTQPPFQSYMPPAYPMQPQASQEQTASPGGPMMSGGEPGPFPPRGPAGMMDYSFGGGQDGMVFSQPSGMQGIQVSQANQGIQSIQGTQNTQNIQGNNSRAEGFGFLNPQTDNQGNPISNRESNW